MRWTATWQFFEVKQESAILGRHSTADVRLADPDISRRHCRFYYWHEAWHVVDLSSLNGIYVNGQRVHETTLYTGDEIRVGNVVLHVERGTEAHIERDPTSEVIRKIAGLLPPTDVVRVS
jgi:pSer/pThr/pTyr-binding forkhead associated (FHA) protein